MRQRLEQQFKLGILQISDTEISLKTRDAQPKLAVALLLFVAGIGELETHNGGRITGGIYV